MFFPIANLFLSSANNLSITLNYAGNCIFSAEKSTFNMKCEFDVKKKIFL